MEIQTLVIEITEACPLDCIGCFIPKQPHVIQPHGFKKIIGETAPHLHEANPPGTVILSGGEPMTHPHLTELIKTCTQHRLKPQIFTSGYAGKEVLPELAPHISMLRVSLKHASPHIDAAYRGKPDSHQQTLGFLEEARRNNIPLTIHNVVDKHNSKPRHLNAIAETARGFDARIVFLPFIAYRHEDKKLMLTDRQLRSLRRFSETVDAEVEMTEEVCVAGIKRLCIDSHGNLRPCLYLENNTGNVIREGLDASWRNARLWRTRLPVKTGCPALNAAHGRRK